MHAAAKAEFGTVLVAAQNVARGAAGTQVRVVAAEHLERRGRLAARRVGPERRGGARRGNQPGRHASAEPPGRVGTGPVSVSALSESAESWFMIKIVLVCGRRHWMITDLTGMAASAAGWLLMPVSGCCLTAWVLLPVQ